MYLILLGLLTLRTHAHTPTTEPTGTQYWTLASCAEDEGVVDCASKKGPGIDADIPFPSDVECDEDDPEDCKCAHYWGRYPDPRDQHWIMAMASIFAMCMAFGIGANDAANSWATSVGAGAISVGYAVLLCGFFEWAGATAVGYGVSKTIQKGVSKLTAPDCWACGKCDSSVTLMMGGSLGALVGASMFLLFASGTAVPVSTTHSIVGGVVGMTMAGAGVHCLNWKVDGGLTGIILSWIISPVLSGVLASTGYSLSLFFIIKSKSPRKRALFAIPVLYGVITFALFMMIFLKAKAIKKKMNEGEKFLVSAIIGAAVLALAWIFLKPIIQRNLPSETGEIDELIKSQPHMNKDDTENPTTPKNVGKTDYAKIGSPSDSQAMELVESKKGQPDANREFKLYKGEGAGAGPVETPKATRSSLMDLAAGDVTGDDLRDRVASVVIATDPSTTKLQDWNVSTTLRWITEAAEGRFAYLSQKWALHKVDGEILSLITEDEMKNDLEVTNLGDRKLIMKLIEGLKKRKLDGTGKRELGGTTIMLDAQTPEQLDAIFVFKYLLVFTACLESFAHGSNDTANATGPFSAVYQLYTNGGKDCSSDEGTVWIMCVAGIFVAIGVATFGYRVIRTIGMNLTMIDFHKGFFIEMGSTFATMIATVMEFPVSTTHCQVGGVIGVGLVTSFRGTGGVSWSLFMKIFLTWVLTLPIAGGGAALVVMIVKGAIIVPGTNCS